MAKAVVLRPLAERDIEEALRYYGSEVGSTLASRWVNAIQNGLERIGAHPGIGSSRYADILQFSGLRSWPLQEFPYLIFYVEHDDSIDVWRVLHGQRDIPTWLGS